MRRLLLIFIPFFCVSLRAGGAEESGLKLEVDAEMIDSAALRVEGAKEESVRDGANLFVHSYLTNVSDHDIVVPTTTRDGGPCCWGDSISGSSILFSIHLGERNGRTIVPSEASHSPVTLKPGESTYLPKYEYRYSEDRLSVADGKVSFKVMFVVGESIAQRYKWWHGSLECEVPISRDEEEDDDIEYIPPSPQHQENEESNKSVQTIRASSAVPLV